MRNSAFWILDQLRGGRITNHFRDIQSLLEKPDSNTSITAKKTYLENLLQHAAESTEFYKPYLNCPLHDFPVISKSTVRENFDRFRSSRYPENELVPMITSGSTGTPFKVLQDKNKKARNSADTIYFAQRAGYHLGDILIYMKIWNSMNSKSSWRSWIENVVPFDVIHLNEEKISRLVDRMQSTRSRFAFLGYASALELICRYLDRNFKQPLDVNVSSIIASSESLNDFTRHTFKKYFNVDAVSRYSNLENGIIAQQVIGSAYDYLANDASYRIEILDLNTDTPVTPGKIGRIIVTDLFNYGMPMIRYDTGDIGSVKPQSVISGNLFLNHVEGRKLDLLYGTNGELVSSYIVYKNMWQYTEIEQYQLVQKGAKDYLFKINSKQQFAREAKLIAEFKQYLGNDANFSVEYVSEIPLLDSGKRKKIVNEFHNKSAH